MGDKKPFKIVGRLATVAGLSLLGIIGSGHLAGVQAATPSSGTVSQLTSSSWHFDPVVQSSPLTGSGIEATCPTSPAAGTTAGYCDNYDLTVDTTGQGTQTATLKINYTWTPLTPAPTDMDVYAFSPTGTEYGPGTPDNLAAGPGQEVLNITNPAAGVWHIRSLCSTCATPQDANATATLTFAAPVTPPTPPAVNPGDPSFTNYPKQNMPNNTADFSGEVSAGADWTTPNTTTPNTVMWQDANPKTFRVTFDDTKSVPTATWTDVTFKTQDVTTLDPIGFMDGTSTSGVNPTNIKQHRFFSDQLLAACSDLAYTDDDGGTGMAGTDWMQSPVGCPVPNGPDHQTVGGGPYPASLAALTTANQYGHAIYYCSQAIATAICGRSDNGGATFNNGVPVYALVAPNTPVGIGQCGGLHGHLRVAPDGTAYLPNKNCMDSTGSHPGVAISKNAGLTWNVSTIPDGVPHSPGSDPSVAAGAKNTVYFGYQGEGSNGGSHAMIAVSHNDGTSWNKSVNVGAAFGIQNIEFPEVIAGDDNRAAFAFLGTTADGNDQPDTFPGVWHLYIAYTYDAGASWTTVDATPTDPVQRGPICTSGTTCGTSRNLLDFNDITLDRSGRVIVAYSDGCIAACAAAGGNSGSTGFRSSLGTLARQNCTTQGALSKGLSAAFDSTGFLGCSSSSPTVSRVTRALVSRHGSQLTFRWSLTNRSGIAGFNVDARSHQLNGHLIPVHAAHSYRFTARYHGAGPFVLHVVHADGRQETVKLG